MALPMVHLIAAYNWAQDKPDLKSCPEYYLGTLSPDAIHIRDGNDKSHKNEIHLNNWRISDPQAVLEYWKEQHTPFDIGYGIHVLLDGQWTERFRCELKGMLLPNGKPDPEIYYNDTVINDYRLYNEYGKRAELFDLFACAHAPENHPLLTAYEINAWNKSVRTEFYKPVCPKNAPVRYITMEYTERFLRDCGKLFDSVYKAHCKR